MNEIIEIEVREDGSRAVASNVNAAADAFEKAGGAGDALQKIMQQVSSTMDKVGTAIDRLNNTLSAQASNAVKVTQAVTQSAAAHDKMTATVDKLAESETECTTRIRAMVQASLAQVQASNAASSAAQDATRSAQGQGAATLAARQANDAAARSYTSAASAAVAQARAVDSLEQALNGGIKNIDQWRATEGALVDAQQRGIITGKQYTQMIQQLDSQLPGLSASINKEQAAVKALTATYDPLSAKMQKLEQDEKTLMDLRNKGLISLSQYEKLQTGISSQKVMVSDGVEKGTKALHEFSFASGGATREYGVLIGELARGNWARLEGSLMTLANRTGILTALMGPLGVALAVVAGVIALLAVAEYDGYIQQQKLNNALITTGNTTGITSTQVLHLSSSLKTAGESSAQMQDLLTQLTASGRVTSDSLEAVGHAAANSMKMTGDSVDSTVQAFDQLYDNPLQWADQMDQKYHFLTLQMRDHIQALVDAGDSYGAVKAAAQDYADATDPRIKDMIDNVGTLEAAWRGVANYLGTVKQFYADIGKHSPLGDFQAAKKDYQDWQAMISRAGPSYNLYDPKNNDVLQRGQQLWQKMFDAREKVVGNQAATEAQAQMDQQRQAVLAAGKGIDSINDKTQKQITYQTKLNLLSQQYKTLWLLDPNDKRLQGVSFDSSGNPSGGSYASKVAQLNEDANGKPKKAPKDRTLQETLKESQAFEQLMGTIDPTRGAMEKLETAQDKLNLAVQHGWISQNDADFAMAQYQMQLFSALNPLEALNQKLDKQIESFKGTAQQSKALQAVEKDRDELMKQGVILTDEQTAALLKKYQVIEADMAQQTLQEKVLRSVTSATREQITELEQLNKLKEAGSLTQDQVNSYEFKKNPGIFNGTGFAQDQQMKQQQDQLALIKQMNKDKVLNEQDTQTAIRNVDNQTHKIRMQGTQNFLGGLAQLSTSHNKKQAAIGKAAAIAQTTINTYQSATEAFTAMAGIPIVGPILGAIAAAAAVASGLAQIQQIRSVNTSAGYMMGGYTGDIPTNQVAGPVHGKEFVSNAATTARYRPYLEAMHNGTFNPENPNNTNGPSATSQPNVQGPQNLRLITTLDPKVVGDFLASEDGDKVLVQALHRNQDIVVSLANG